MMTANSSSTPISLCVKLSHGELKQWNTSFDDLNVDHLWMIFGKGKDLRRIPIHDIC
jgi:hypothetical protein